MVILVNKQPKRAVGRRINQEPITSMPEERNSNSFRNWDNSIGGDRLDENFIYLIDELDDGLDDALRVGAKAF